MTIKIISVIYNKKTNLTKMRTSFNGTPEERKKLTYILRHETTKEQFEELKSILVSSELFKVVYYRYGLRYPIKHIINNKLLPFEEDKIIDRENQALNKFLFFGWRKNEWIC